MKKILGIITLFVMSGCSTPVPMNNNLQEFTFTVQNRGSSTNELEKVTVAVVVIDSCEYLCSETAYSYMTLCHKGNCKYCKIR
jgi:hypothetical protein